MSDPMPEFDGFWSCRLLLKGAGPAFEGGKPAVNYPLKKQMPVLEWPRYVKAVKDAVHAALDYNCGSVYQYPYDLEDEWRPHDQIPFVKCRMNGAGAVTPARQRTPLA